MQEVKVTVYADNKQTKEVKGPFFVKALDLDEIIEFKELSEKETDQHSLLVQSCLVTKDGKQVFSPQQRKLIKKRVIGTHLIVIMGKANQINDFDSMNQLAEDYEKNSESGQN